jgi:hypothetical protein
MNDITEFGERRVEKLAVPVRLTLATGLTLGGEAFLEPHQRLIDMFNDGNNAFMFRSENAAGEKQVWVISKRHVVEMEVLKLHHGHGPD